MMWHWAKILAARTHTYAHTCCTAVQWISLQSSKGKALFVVGGRRPALTAFLSVIFMSTFWALFSQHFFFPPKKCWEKSAVQTSWDCPQSQDSCFEHFMGLFCIFAHPWSSQYFVFSSGTSLQKNFAEDLWAEDLCRRSLIFLQISSPSIES